MRKFLSIVFIIILCMSVAAPDVSYASSIKLNKTKLELSVGKTYMLKLNGSSGSVTWTSSKKSVATVSSSGKISAIKEGKTVITAINKKKSFKCIVSVVGAYVKVTVSDFFTGGEDISEYLSSTKFVQVVHVDDYTTTYTMTKSQQKNLLQFLKESFTELMGDKEIPNYYISFTPNDDFTSFDVVAEPKEYAEKSSDDFTLVGVALYSALYQQFSGIEMEDTRYIIHVYDTEGNEIDTVDYDSSK